MNLSALLGVVELLGASTPPPRTNSRDLRQPDSQAAKTASVKPVPDTRQGCSPLLSCLTQPNSQMVISETSSCSLLETGAA